MKIKFASILLIAIFLFTSGISSVYADSSVDVPSTTKADKAFTIIVKGENMDSPGLYDGEVRYIPASINIKCISGKDNEYDYKKSFNENAPYRIKTKIRAPGKYRITVDFNIEKFEKIDTSEGGVANTSSWRYAAGYFMVKKDINIKGQLKFNGNNGKVKTSSKWFTYGKKYGKLPKATRSGHEFSGWYTKKKGGAKIAASTKYKAAKPTLTVYAHWSKISKKPSNKTNKKPRAGNGDSGGDSNSYAASVNTDVFHYSWCSYVKRIKSSNLVYYSNRSEAVSSGKRPCKVCRP
jgi:uncharacterized repeat protein (TIGR02543 family)